MILFVFYMSLFSICFNIVIVMSTINLFKQVWLDLAHSFETSAFHRISTGLFHSGSSCPNRQQSSQQVIVVADATQVGSPWSRLRGTTLLSLCGSIQLHTPQIRLECFGGSKLDESAISQSHMAKSRCLTRNRFECF